jgi:hypothetical protein
MQYPIQVPVPTTKAQNTGTGLLPEGKIPYLNHQGKIPYLNQNTGTGLLPEGKIPYLNHYFVYHIAVPVLDIPEYQFRAEECGSGADQRTPTSGKSPKSWIFIGFMAQ